MPSLCCHQLGRLDRECFDERNAAIADVSEGMLDQLVKRLDIICPKRVEEGCVGSEHLLSQSLIFGVLPHDWSRHCARGNVNDQTLVCRMRHDGCGGLPGRAELMTGIEGASSRPVRRIKLLGLRRLRWATPA